VPANDDSSNWRPPNEHAMFRTVNALLMHQLKLKMHDGDATNTNDDDDDDDGFVDHHPHDSVLLRGIRRAPDSLDFSRKRRFVSLKFQLPDKEEALNEIIEECEYDSDIGKFKCKDDEAIDPDESENSSTSSMVDHYLQIEHMNDLNSPLKCVNKSGLDVNNFDNIERSADDGDSHYKIVMKRIEFFETGTKQENVKQESVDVVDTAEKVAKDVATKPTGENQILSTILFAIFILTVALLIVFPLPN
jgi:hypothetical protein